MEHRHAGANPKLHYSVLRADGPSILFLHGVTRNWSDWKDVIDAIPSRYQVIALDHRGHGRSEWAVGYRVIDYAQDLVHFLRSELTSPVHIVGHSLGAMVGLFAAAHCRDRVASLVLEDPPFHTMGNRIFDSSYRELFMGMHRIANMGIASSEQISRLFGEIEITTPSGQVRLSSIRDSESIRFSAECLQYVDPAVYGPLIAGKWLDDFDYQELWSNVDCPTLLLQGDPNSGGAFTPEDVELARNQLRHSKRIVFDEVGHQIHRTCQSRFIAEVLAHIEG